MSNLNLLPCPRSLKVLRGTFTLPRRKPLAAIKVVRTDSAPNHPEGYTLTISKNEVEISFRETGGLRAASATLRQLLREYGRALPCLRIRDWPDFARRGVMLDISRGRVPKLETLLDLAEKLSDFKINELQLYTEHTFAYRKYKSVWQSWGALTAREIQILDTRCRELGIDLVPNQNSFGHLRYFLADPRLKKLGELSEPYEGGGDTPSPGDEGVATTFLRRPTTLAPNHPGTLPFLRSLYDELLPNFSSDFFNIGGDETWDLGKGQSKKLCETKGKGRIYFDFLKSVYREVAARDKKMMFWGDIILKYPQLLPELAALGTPASGTASSSRLLKHAGSETGVPNLIALNWGYEIDHPFDAEAAQFAKANIPFYVCPGTSTWQTLIGKHDNALANLRAAAKAGKKHGALGYLNTDWGDGGHPQPLAVSWPLLAAGAALAWNSKALDEPGLLAVLSRDVFDDPTGKIAKAGFKLGFAHRILGVKPLNETPLGTVIAAPKPAARELFCRNGLKWFAKIPKKKIVAALKEIQKQRSFFQQARSAGRRPGTNRGQTETRRVGDRRSILVQELDLAARMAEQSCQFMLWQQAAAAGKTSEAKKLARQGVRELRKLENDFNACWPLRNKATTKHCSPFFQWRIEDYNRSRWV